MATTITVRTAPDRITISPTDIQVSITDPIHEHADADGHVHMNGDEHADVDPATSNNMGYSNTILLHNNRPPLTPTSLSSSLSASNNINISRKKRFKKRLRLRKMFRKSSSKSKVSGTGTAGTNTETNSSSSFNGTYDHQSQSASELSTQNSILSLGTISMMSQTELDDAQYDYDEAFHSHISSPIGMYTTYPLEETDEGTSILREKNRKGNVDIKDGKKGKDSIDANATTGVKTSTSTNSSTTDKQSSKLRWRKSAPSAANAIDSVSTDDDAPPPPPSPSPISTSSPNSSSPKYVGRRHTLEHITEAMKKSVSLASRPCVSPSHIRSQSLTTDNHDHDAPFHPMMSLSLSPSADSNDDASTSTNNSNSYGNFNCTSNRLSYLYTLGKKLRSQGLYDKAKAAYTEALNILHNANVDVNANASATTPSSSSPSSYTTQKAMIRYELAKLKFAQYMEENGNDHHTEESRQTLSRLMQHVEIMRCKVSLQNLEFYQGQLHNMDTRVEKEDFRLDYHQIMERLNILHTLGKLCEKDLHRYEDALVYYQRALNIEEQMRNSWRKQMAKAKTKTKANQVSDSGAVDDGRSVQATEVELKEWSARVRHTRKKIGSIHYTLGSFDLALFSSFSP